MINKKAQTFKSLLWMFGFIVLFIMALAVASNQMNSLYGGNNDLTYGIVSNTTYERLQTYQSELDTDLRGSDSGQASYSQYGLLTLTKLPKIIWGVMGMSLDFITGGWIDNALSLVPLGELGGVIIILLRVLFTIFIMFIVIKLIMRAPA